MNTKKRMQFFAITTYVGFYILLVICLVIMKLGAPAEMISNYAPILGSWLSFAVLMIWSAKLLPETTRKGFIKNLFRDRIKGKQVALAIGIPVGIFFLTVLGMVFITGRSLGQLMNGDISAIFPVFLVNLAAGPTGEEPGWRGFFLTRAVERNGILKGSVITGIVWGFWHMPLWFMTGYTPGMLVVYILSFIVTVISISIILGVIYTKHRNLWYCIIIHLLFNFMPNLLIVDQNEFVAVLAIMAVLYTLTATVMYIRSRKEVYDC